MTDAAWLAQPVDDMQGPLWRPTSIEDRDRHSRRTIDYFQLILAGRRVPAWDWWREKGSEEYAHSYRASFAGYPTAAARCLSDDEPFALGVTDWERSDATRCPLCLEAIEGPKQPSAAALNRAEAARYGFDKE